MTVMEAAYVVLKEAKQPLHYTEITKRILERGLWTTQGKTPEHTVNAQLVTEINNNGEKSQFRRYGPGIYGLVDDQKNIPPLNETQETLSFSEAAEQVLQDYSEQKPMHYRDITKIALDKNLIKTQGQTPVNTMYTQIFYDIKRNNQRGEISRFENLGKGYFGLSQWHDQGLAYEIEKHNDETKTQLHLRIREMSPSEFEALIGVLLTAIGFDSVSITPAGGDAGIDVRGTLVVGDVIRTKMAVQVKRWKHNVQSPIIQQVRGSLGTHEQGLIITTSDFSSGARMEAERPDATPVALMSGEQLVDLLIEHDIGIRRTKHFLIDLAEPDHVPEGDD